MPPAPLLTLSKAWGESKHSLSIGIKAAARPRDTRVGARACACLRCRPRREKRWLGSLLLLDVLHPVGGLRAVDVLVEARLVGGARVADRVLGLLLLREARRAVEVRLLLAVAALVLLVLVRVEALQNAAGAVGTRRRLGLNLAEPDLAEGSIARRMRKRGCVSLRWSGWK